MSDSLAKTGWRLRPDWNPCASTSGKSAKDVNALALNTDLKDSGEAYISDILSQGSGTGFLDVGADGAVLQVTKIRNIAAPKSNEDSGVAPRMLKLILTDGHSNLQALEIERLDKISLNTPPGTKVRLKSVPSKIVVKSGFALIQAKNLELLGGKVEPLIEKWEISQKLAQFTRAQNTGAEGEPPPWVPFGKNIGQAVDRGFKALAGKHTSYVLTNINGKLVTLLSEHSELSKTVNNTFSFF